MSDRQLPDWIDAFMRYTENSEPPILYRKWTAISVIAATLQRKCYVQWGTHLKFYPNLYVVLVGPSGVRKSVAMGPGLDLLQELGKAKIAAQATTREALIRRLKETNYADPDLETGRTQFHSSMTIFSKEFTVFLGYHNRELMSALCDWYDCESVWTYETISRKEEQIVGVWVNIIGATTPELIQSSMPLDAIGGGLTSRIIYIYEEQKEKWISAPMTSSVEEAKLRQFLLHDLDKIYTLSGMFKYSEGFLDKWVEWYEGLKNAPPPFQDDKFAGYIERRPNHVMKLSMVMSASRADGPSMVLTGGDFEKALATLQQAEVKMVRTFSGVGRSSVSEMLPRVMTFLAMQRKTEVPVYEVAQRFQADVDDWMLERIIKSLEAMNYAKLKAVPGGPKTLVYCGPEAMLNNSTKEENNE